MKCDKCNEKIEEKEKRELHGKTLCEDCYIDKLTPAKACDPWAVFAAKSVFVSGGEEYKYDKLFLATGSRSFIPSIEGTDLEGVMRLRGIDDAERMKSYMADKNPKKIIFILGRRTIGELTTFTSARNPDICSEPSAEPITIAAEQALQKLKQEQR